MKFAIIEDILPKMNQTNSYVPDRPVLFRRNLQFHWNKLIRELILNDSWSPQRRWFPFICFYSQFNAGSFAHGVYG